MNQKSVGLITMHRVINVGSILQAYALYLQVKKLGFNCEIIDYQYPNEFHKSNRTLEKKWKIQFGLLIQRIKFFLFYDKTIQKKRFGDFLKKNLSLSSTYYKDVESIHRNPPIYDIYMTGSDQVWNPECMQGDTTFFCSFISNKPKVSYASSFSISDIPNNLKLSYANALKSYKMLGVREKSGVDLIKKLTGLAAVEVCDPTLLLSKDDYAKLALSSKIRIKRPYILAYILDYSYNPYPTIQQVVNIISKQMNMQVYYLHANSVDNYHYGHSITSAGPSEFLYLFLNSSFVVTSSFHGTAFALNFEKPFYSVIPQTEQEDSRIYSLLKKVKAEDRAIKVNTKVASRLSTEMDYTNEISSLLQKYKEESRSFLYNSLIQSLQK